MGRFDSAIASATRLIEKNGQVVTWRRIVDGAADDETPWKPGNADQIDQEVAIVFLPESRVGFEFLALITNTEVPRGKLIGLMAPQDFIPTLKDIVVRDGTPMALRYVDVIAPNGTPILYTLGFDL